MDGVAHGPPSFEAELYPNPPMSRYGLLVLMGLFSVMSLIVAVVFAFAGAWPISGFLGLDVVALGVALVVVRRRARRFEQITLSGAGLRVRKVEPNGCSADWWFEPHWVRVLVEQPGPEVVRLWLRSHGRRLRIGHFLAPEECKGLAVALDRALAPYR